MHILYTHTIQIKHANHYTIGTNYTLILYKSSIEILFSFTRADEGINPSKAAGIDGQTSKFRLEGTPCLTSPITQLWFTTQAKTCRPISLLPLISKLIENAIRDQTPKIFMWPKYII